ncbi:MAG: PAS domain S-box protein [Haloferacaceae archaeon]
MKRRGGALDSGLILLGIAFFLVSLAHAFEPEPLANVALGVVPPAVGALGIGYAGVRLSRTTLEEGHAARLLGWVALGTVGSAGLAGTFVLYQTIHGVDVYDVEYVLVNTLVAGIVVALVVGGYDVRSRRRADQLDVMNRVLDTVRRVKRDVVEAKTRRNLERGLCEQFADSKRYEFASVATYDPAADLLTPHTAAGIEVESLSPISSTDDTALARTARERTAQRRDLTDADVPWFDGDLEGSESCLFVPLAFEGTLYGVVTVCTASSPAFEDTEVEVLSELGETVAHAISRLEVRGSLERSERRFRHLFDRHSAPMLLIDPDSGDIIRANDAAVEFYGYDDLTSTNIDEINTLDSEEIDVEMARAERLDRSYFVFEHRLASGETRTVEVHSTPVPMAEGTTLFSIVHDITEREEYERALESEREFVDTALNTLTDHFFVVDPEEGLVRWNDRVPEVTGYAEETLSSADPTTFFREEDGDRVQAALDRTLAEGSTSLRADLVTRDGEEIPMEYRAKSLTDEAGEPTKIVGIGRNISDQLAYEAELERYKELVENVPVGIFRSTAPPEDDLLEVNPAMVDLFDADSREQLLDRPVSGLYADAADRESFAEQLRESGIVREKELELETLSGETFWASIVAIEHETPDGRRYFEGAIEDVTERREYEHALERHADELELLNGLLRHDIRNDMTVICGMAEVLSDHVDESGAGDLDVLESKAEHVVELTHTARDLTRSMQFENARSPSLEAVSLRSVLERELAEARSSYAAADVVVDGEIPDVEVRANELLGAVFRNLLNNAVQHNVDDPWVQVGVSRDGAAAVVRVADDGPGIPDSMKDQVFEHGTKGDHSAGTGLGLHLVETLVRQYGGDIDVADRTPTGTVFTVRLPLADGGE